MTMQNKSIDMDKIRQILQHGNTAEVMYTKHGITIFEVSKKIRYQKPKIE